MQYSISDDGSRVVFSTPGNLTGENPDLTSEIFAINADGTNLRQITSSSEHSEYPRISGNGSKIVFESSGDLVPGNNTDHSREIFIMNYDGSSLKQLTKSFQYSQRPSITDDGALIVFSSSMSTIGQNPDLNSEIWKIKADGSGLTLLTNTMNMDNLNPIVSGGSGRIAFITYGESPWGSNPDWNAELNMMDISGNNKMQLTNVVSVDILEPDMAVDGTQLVFSSNLNASSQNHDFGYEIFRIENDGSGLAQVTNISDGSAAMPSVTADGTKVAFVCNGNPLGQNPDFGNEIFVIQSDGNGLQQLTNNSNNDSSHPAFSLDGSIIIFDSYADLDGTEGDVFSRDIFAITSNGATLYRLTSGPENANSSNPRVDENGTWIVFDSEGDPAGANPDGSFEVFRIRKDGVGLQQVTSDPSYSSGFPDISADSARIVFESMADLTGTNPDHNNEIFLYDIASSTSTQLTVTSKGYSYYPRFSKNGSFVYFISSAPILEDDPDSIYDAYRIDTSTHLIERVSALATSGLSYYDPIAPNRDGSIAVAQAFGNQTEQNPDLNSELFLIDRNRAASIRIGKDAPTLVSWDYESGPIRYDVIRGNIDNLRFITGNISDLGTVICLENDSPDVSTAGFEDSVQPGIGQCFFYLYRGSQGLYAGPGSYGKASNGYERQASAGDCTP